MLLRPNPEWLLARTRTTPCTDCQFLVRGVPPSRIVDIVRVFDGVSGRVLPEFDPKHQRKLKHKERCFASLFRHHLGR